MHCHNALLRDIFSRIFSVEDVQNGMFEPSMMMSFNVNDPPSLEVPGFPIF